jgi:hypothetical protein
MVNALKKEVKAFVYAMLEVTPISQSTVMCIRHYERT